MLTRDHQLRGFRKEVEPSGLFTLTFEGRPVANQLTEADLGPQADITWERFLRQRRTLGSGPDDDGQVE